jgi:hypothetical protein
MQKLVSVKAIAGPSGTASRPPRTNSVSITMRPAPGMAGSATLLAMAGTLMAAVTDILFVYQFRVFIFDGCGSIEIHRLSSGTSWC